MEKNREIVITGTGVVSPIGIGCSAYWSSICNRRSSVRRLELGECENSVSVLVSDIQNFEPKKLVRPRKSLKVMSRDIQLGFVASDLACQQAGVDGNAIEPERIGVVFGSDMIACDLNDGIFDAFKYCATDKKFDFSRWGKAAMSEMFPLWMLKFLPNMPACHIGISRDARGPNNSLVMSETSSLAAIVEAIRVIRRGQADVMVAGGASSRTHNTIWGYKKSYCLSERIDVPEAASRPFDSNRDGTVHSEGAAAFVLEERQHADARGATILAKVLGFGEGFEPSMMGRRPQGKAIRKSIEMALSRAGLKPRQIGHVNAHGLSTPHDDRIEAVAIKEILGDVPVTAPKSYFGNIGAGTGAVELVASLLAIKNRVVPPTLNYETPDPECPINVVREQIDAPVQTALVQNQSRTGHAIAIILADVD